jgi:hypothetical protein
LVVKQECLAMLWRLAMAVPQQAFRVTWSRPATRSFPMTSSFPTPSLDGHSSE